MTIAVIVTFKVQHDKYADFLAFLQKELPHTRSFQGCIGLEVACRSSDATVVLHEVWASKEDQLAYRAWRAERGDGEKFVSYVREAPDFADWDYLDIPRA